MAKYEKLMISDMKIDTVLKGHMLVVSIDERSAKNGNPFCVLELSDGVSKATARLFDCGKDQFGIPVGAVAYLQIKTTEYGGKPSYTIQKYAAANPDCTLKPGDFIRRAPMESEEMFDGIIEMLSNAVEGSHSGTLSEIAINLYRQNMRELLYWSAAKSVHHDMYGGLLYHTYRMMKLAKSYISVYPSLDPELLLSAVALHDIGKLKELKTDNLGSADYTLDGNLFGHAAIGMDMVKQEAAKGEYDDEKVRMLLHCIASHHGQLEYGAITIPMTEEAAILNKIDDSDARIMMFESEYAGMESGTCSAGRVFGLDTKVYKPKFK